MSILSSFRGRGVAKPFAMRPQSIGGPAWWEAFMIWPWACTRLAAPDMSWSKTPQRDRLGPAAWTHRRCVCHRAFQERHLWSKALLVSQGHEARTATPTEMAPAVGAIHVIATTILQPGKTISCPRHWQYKFPNNNLLVQNVGRPVGATTGVLCGL